MHKPDIYFKEPESTNSNIALGTDVPLMITVREKKLKSIQKNASWQICVDEANDVQRAHLKPCCTLHIICKNPGFHALNVVI